MTGTIFLNRITPMPNKAYDIHVDDLDRLHRNKQVDDAIEAVLKDEFSIWMVSVLAEDTSKNMTALKSVQGAFTGRRLGRNYLKDFVIDNANQVTYFVQSQPIQ